MADPWAMHAYLATSPNGDTATTHGGTTGSDAPKHQAADTLALVYNLIAASYASPGQALREDVESGRFDAALAALAKRLELAPVTLGDAAFDTLRAQYVDLFVSSGTGLTSPPYLGYAVDGELLGPAAEAMGRFLLAHDVGINLEWTDMPDHLAAIGEAGLFLLGMDRTDAALELLERYVRPWFDRYATAVATKDVSGFYGPLTTFMHASIREVTRGNGS